MNRPALFLLLFACLASPLPAVAQTARQDTPPADTERDVSARTTQWDATLDQVRRQVRSRLAEAPELKGLREEAERIRSEAEAVRDQANKALAEQKSLIEALGPAPAAGAPAEAPSLVAQRRRLETALSAIQARQKQAEFAVARAQTLIDEARGAERRRVAEQLLTRDATPLAPELWTKGVAQIADFGRTLVSHSSEWWESGAIRTAGRLAAMHIVIVLAMIVIGLWPLRRWLLRRFGRDPRVVEPDAVQVLAAALSEGFGRAVLPALSAEAVRAVLAINGLLDTLFGAFLGNVLHGLALYFLVTGLAAAAFVPGLPGWRAFHLTEDSASRLVRRFNLLAIALAIAAALNTMTAGYWGGQEEMNVLRTSFTGVLFALVLLSFTDSRLWNLDRDHRDAAPVSPGVGRLARRVTWVMLPPALVALLLGYDDLAEFVILGLLLSGLASATYILLRSALGAILDLVLGQRPIAALQAKLEADGERGGLRFWLGGTLELLLFLLYVFALTQAWSIPTDQVLDFSRRAVEGFRFGGLTISVGDIAAALALFAAGLFATRFGQNTLRDRILPQTRLDTGVRHSLVAGLGYVGFIVAAVLAISALGINLSNIALIAGALSVGIGFGLQNIVNNFVSGLILLVERPVKVGDWVVVGQHEGYVRRISVRATEIETFPRAAVIVPNSELLSGAVTNWTYKNKLGRVEVTVGVAYGSDVVKVRDILLGCVTNLPGVLTDPPPHVVFRDFADSALVFKVRGYIGDVEQRLVLESDLRFAIVAAFNQAGIEIPYSQTDVNLRDIGRIEKLVAEYLARPAPGRTEPS